MENLLILFCVHPWSYSHNKVHQISFKTEKFHSRLRNFNFSPTLCPTNKYSPHYLSNPEKHSFTPLTILDSKRTFSTCSWAHIPSGSTSKPQKDNSQIP